MPRKDVEWIQKKGLTTDEVISILEKHFESEESEEVEEEEIEEIEEEVDQEVDQVDEEEEIEQISMDELDKKIDDRIQKILKIKRKVPSKGKVIKTKDAPTEPDIIKKNWFEELV